MLRRIGAGWMDGSFSIAGPRRHDPCGGALTTPPFDPCFRSWQVGPKVARTAQSHTGVGTGKIPINTEYASPTPFHDFGTLHATVTVV
jgi:hypothetical protein